jgi:hypothetical protein
LLAPESRRLAENFPIATIFPKEASLWPPIVLFVLVPRGGDRDAIAAPP